MVSLIVLRKTKKDVHRPYKVIAFILILFNYFTHIFLFLLQVHISIAILTLLVAIFLSAIPLIVDPTPKYLIALLFVALGILLYYVLIYKGKTPSFMGEE